MASIFRQQYTQKDPLTGKTVLKKSRYWYIDYKGPDGIRCRVKGYKDKTATAQLAARLELEAERTDSGILDRFKEHRKTPLAEHLKTFKQSLLSSGGTAKNADLKTARIERVFKECGFVFIPDISASRVHEAIAGFRKTVEIKTKEGQKSVKDLGAISSQSKNHYLAACKQFCGWLVKDCRTGDNPLTHLQAVKVIKTKGRRAMTADEISLLLHTVQTGPERSGMMGTERAMLYRLAVETGLRAGELRALKVSDFDLSGRTVTLAAEYTKNRNGANLPLRTETAERLRTFLAGKLPTAAVFNMPRIEAVSKMIQADLKEAGINVADDGTGKLDFHSLRHSFATLLIHSGIDVKTAQTLLRHSTPVLTLGVYTHRVRGAESSAIDRLPDFNSKPQSERAKATGTDGKVAETAANQLTNQLTKSSDFSRPQVSFSGTHNEFAADNGQAIKNPALSEKTGFSSEKTHRRRRDSNPRYLSVQRFSRPSPSAARSLLQVLYFKQVM